MLVSNERKSGFFGLTRLTETFGMHWTGNGVRMRTLDESSSEFKRLWHLRQKSQPTVQETASVFLFFDCLSAKYPGENGIEPAERIGRVYDGFVSLGMLNQVVWSYYLVSSFVCSLTRIQDWGGIIKAERWTLNTYGNRTCRIHRIPTKTENLEDITHHTRHSYVTELAPSSHRAGRADGRTGRCVCAVHLSRSVQ